MKRIYILLLSVIPLLSSCCENDRMLWDAHAGVYFVDYNEKADSLLYSFRISAQDRDTLYLMVKLQGQLLESPKAFRLKVEENSTAVEGRHYVALDASYHFPEDKAVMALPVVVLNSADLDDNMVSLNLRLEATDEMELALPGQDNVRLLLTNRLIKPYYWEQSLVDFFGEYSQVKHMKCIEIMGHDFPLKKSELAYFHPQGFYYWRKIGREVCNFYVENTVYDENGRLIVPWDPF